MITKKGVITSAKMTGTVTVTVHRSVYHPLYKKSFRMSKKFLADSKGFDVRAGDEVMIGECRPISKNKHFKILEITKQAPRVSEIGEEKALSEAMKSKVKKPSSESSESSESSVSSESSSK
jgi:small subunit ribosomal protein S17